MLPRKDLAAVQHRFLQLEVLEEPRPDPPPQPPPPAPPLTQLLAQLAWPPPAPPVARQQAWPGGGQYAPAIGGDLAGRYLAVAQEDVRSIEAGRVPLPNYPPQGESLSVVSAAARRGEQRAGAARSP